MLFSNFLCLFYLMVLTRCHTISKSIVNYDQLDDAIDSVNDYPLTAVFNLRNERTHPMYRRDGTGTTTALIARTAETTTKSKEKVTMSLITKTTEHKETTKTHKSPTESTKPVTASQLDNFKANENSEKPSMNLFRRLKHKFSWKNRMSSKSSTKKKKLYKKHKETTTKMDREKRVAMDRTPSNEFDQITGMFSTFKTTPKILLGDENIMSNINKGNIIETVDDKLYQTISPFDGKEAPLPPFTSPTEKFSQELQDDDIFRGTVGIEALLNKIKMHAIDVISENSDSIGEIISNSVTETTFEADPMLRTIAIKSNTEKPTAFDFRDVVDLAESDEDNGKAAVAPETKNIQPEVPVGAVGYNLEYKLQKEVKYALTKAKDTLTGGLNKACDQMKGVTWKFVHSTAGELNNIANKIEPKGNVKKVPESKPKNKLPLITTQVTKPAFTNSSTLQNYKQNLKSKVVTSPAKKLAKPLPQASAKHITTRESREKATTATSSNNEKDAKNEEQDDYSLLKESEKYLERKDSTIKMLTPAPGFMVKSLKGKVSKRDTETLEHLNLQETIRKINDGEGMPDEDFNKGYGKPSPGQTHIPDVELYSEGSTAKLTEATLRELASPDNSYVGLTNKIHYNEFVNGYKHYLNFARDLSKFDHNFSNHVLYQAHRHHSVDDIGRFILTRLPPIPEWKTLENRRDKRVSLFEELDEENRKTNSKNDRSWFQRHFNLFYDASPKKKFHTQQTVTLKSEISTESKKDYGAQLTITKNDELQLGEKEGIKIGWVWSKKPKKASSKATKVESKLILPPYASWQPVGETATSKTESTSLETLYEHTDSQQTLTDIDVGELMKSIGNALGTTDKHLSGDGKSQTDGDINELMNKISKLQSAKLAISKIYSEHTSTAPVEETNFDMNIQSLASTTFAPPESETLFLNELVSALILHNPTPGSNFKVTKINGPRQALFNKILNRAGRAAIDKKEDEANKDANENFNQLLQKEKDTKNSSYTSNEEFEQIASNIPANLFQDAALNPQQDIKFDKLGYVNLDLVAKPATSIQQKNKSAHKTIFEKLKFKKKKKGKGKDKKGNEKSRKARHSAFKLLKNLFKASVQTESGDSLYGTTEPFSYKYADVERSLKEFMKQVPNISTEEVTYTPHRSSTGFPSAPTVTMNPVFAITTTARPGTFTTPTSPAATDVRQQIKKKQYKPNNENDYSPFHFRVSPNLKNKASPTLHVTLTPVTLDDLMKELRVNMYNNKLKANKISFSPRSYIYNPAENRIFTKMTSKPTLKDFKLKSKQYFDNLPDKDMTKLVNKAYTPRNIKLNNEVKNYGIQSRFTDYKNNKDEIKSEDPFNNNFNYAKDVYYENNDKNDDNQLYAEYMDSGFDKDEGSNHLNSIRNTDNYNTQNDIFFNSNHDDLELSTISNELYGTKNLQFDKDSIIGTRFNSIKEFAYNADEIYKNPYTSASDKNEDKNQYNTQSTDINRYIQNKKDKTDFDEMYRLQNIEEAGKLEMHFPVLKNLRYGSTDFKLQNFRNDIGGGIHFQNIFDDETTEYQSFKTTKGVIKNLKRNKINFRSTKAVPRNNVKYKTGTTRRYTIKSTMPDTKHYEDILDSIGAKIHNSHVVLREKRMKEKFYENEKTTKPLTSTKANKSFPNYFDDFVNWNQDILSLDRVTNPSYEKIMDNLINATMATVESHQLMDEIMHMQNYLKNMSLKNVLIHTNAMPRKKLKTTTTTMLNKISKTKKDLKVIKRRGNDNEKTRIQSLDQLNQMVDNINKMYKKSFNKYDLPEESTKGSVLTTFSLDDVTQSPIMDSTIFAYDDSLSIIPAELNIQVGGYSSTPKTIRSKTDSKGGLSSKTKISPSPEQYFRTPVPMQPQEFDKFLKDHDLYIPNITSPYTEISKFEKNWEKEHHIQSKLMDTRGKHEKFHDVPKLLKDLDKVEFTPDRVIIKLPDINNKMSSDNITYKYKVAKTEKNTPLKRRNEYVNLNESEYTGYPDDNIESGAKNKNTYNIEDTLKTKRKIKPINSQKTSSITPFKTTNIPSINFDITIIDIDDIMSISKSETLQIPKVAHTSPVNKAMSISKSGNSKVAHTSPVNEATSVSPETQIPTQNVPDTQIPVQNIPDSQTQNVPDTQIPVQNVPDSQTQNVPDTQIPVQNVPDSQTQNVPDTRIPVQNVPDSQTQSVENTQTHEQNVPETQNVQKTADFSSLDIDPQPQTVPDFNSMPQEILDHYPSQDNIPEDPNDREDEIIFENQYEDDSHNPEDGFSFDNVKTSTQEIEKYKAPTAKYLSSKYKPSDSAESEFYLNSLGTKVNRKLKIHKGKKQHDKNVNIPHSLHNDLLYQNFNIDQFVGTTPEQTLLPNKGPTVQLFNHKIVQQPKKHPSSTTANTDDDNSEDLERLLDSRREMNLHTQNKVLHAKIRLASNPTRAFTAKRTTKIYSGDDLFAVKPSKQRLSTLPYFSPASKINLQQKFWKQPKRIMFTSHTMKYDVMYDDYKKKWKSHQGFAGGASQHQTTPRSNYAQMTNMSRSTDWKYGVGEDGGIDVDKIIREVIGGTKGNRRRRKAMWHKWRTTNATTTTTTTEKTKQTEATPTRKLFKFIPMMQKSDQKAKTTKPPSTTSSILILPSDNSTNSPILLTSAVTPQLANFRGDRHSDVTKGERNSDIVYIVDVLNGNHQIQQMSAVTAAVALASAEGTEFPKPGDITFMYPARVVNDGGKPKITHKEGTFVEQDWSKTLKPHIPHFRPYHKPDPQKTQDNTWSYQDVYIEEKREQPKPQYRSTFSLKSTSTSTDIYDTPEMSNFLKEISEDTTEHVVKTITEKMFDVPLLLDSVPSDFGDNLALQPHNTKVNKDDVSKLQQEIIKIENEMESKKLHEQDQAALKSLTEKDILEEIGAIDSKSSTQSNTKTVAEKITTSTKSMNSVKTAEKKQDSKEKAKEGKEHVDNLQQTADQKKLTDMENAINKKKVAVANQKTTTQQLSDSNDKAKEPAKEKQTVAQQKATKYKTNVDKTAESENLRNDTKQITAKSSKLTTTTDKMTKSKLNSKHTTYKSSATKALTKPAALTTSKVVKTTSAADTKGKKKKTSKPSNTTVPSNAIQTAEAMTIAMKETKKAKNSKPKLTKRETDNAIYTAKDVAALEVIVDLMKDATDSTPTGKNKPVKYTENNHHLPSTNAIQVHIALPYQIEDRKRAAEPTKLRKVFSATMSVPVDIEYQVRSLNVDDRTRKPFPKSAESGISPGMYLLVEDSKSNQGYALKPVVRQVSEKYESTMKTTSSKNLARVTLSKDYIQSINNQLKQLYQNISTMNQTTKQTVKKRQLEGEHLRNRRIINWNEVRKMFVSNKRVCNCKCVANQTMCKACAASDAVMTELLFEFDNLAKYMDDHCTEIQTYFWMNPSGGRKLRDMVHKIDKNINDYYKRVKGKCRGRPCNAFDKREITIPHIINEDAYIGNPLLADMEYLAQSLQEAQRLKLICSAEFKNIVDRLVQITNHCIGNKKFKRAASEQKKIYSLDNINVNIICNQDSSLQTETSSSPSSVYDLLTTEFPVFDYTDDEVKKSTRKSLKSIFGKRKSRRSHKKASKRDTVVQIETPLHVSDTQGLWREYLNDATKATTGHVKPVITLDVLEKTDDHTVTLNPRLKATLVKILPESDSIKNRDEIFPKRVSRQDYFFNIDDLTTKPYKKKDVRELLKIFELNTQGNKGITGFFRERFAKATQCLKSDTTETSTKESHSPKEKVKIVSSVKTVTTTKAAFPSEIKQYSNITSTSTTPFILMNTDPYGDVNVQDNLTSTSTSTSQTTTTEKTKESWFDKFKKIVTQGYGHATQTPKSDTKDNKYSQKELSSRNVAIRANMDVISDITTTSFPTLFIIDDIPNDANNSDYENLLIKIMEYERDKLDSELTKHKIRQKNISDEDAMNIYEAEPNKESRVATPNPNTKKPSKVTELPIKTDVAEGEYCIHKIWNKYKPDLAPAPQYEDDDFLTTQDTTIKQKDSKNIIKMLLQSVKRSSQKAGKQTMISEQHPSNQEKQMNPPTESTEINRQEQLENINETKITPQELANSISNPENTPTKAEIPSEHDYIVGSLAKYQQTPKDKDNVDWFLAQFASTIIFTSTDYTKYNILDNFTEKLNGNKEDITYKNVPDSTKDSSNPPRDETPITITTTEKSKNFGLIKSPFAIHSKVEVVPYPKNKSTQFDLDVEHKKGKDTNDSKFKSKQASFASDNITTFTSSLPTTTSNEKTEAIKATEYLAPIPFTTDKQKANSIKDDEETYAGVEPDKGEADKSEYNKETTASINNLTKKAEDKQETVPSSKLKDETIVTPEPSEAQPIKSDSAETKPEKDINRNNHEEKVTSKMEEAKPTNIINEPEKATEKLEETSKTEINKEHKTSEKLNETKTKNVMNTKQKSPANIKKTKSKTSTNKEQNSIKNLKETKSKNTNNRGEVSTESEFKKVLNKDFNKQKKYIREACDPKTENCLCDISATSEHIVDVRKTSTRNDFEEYVKNVTCYAYKKPPLYFLIEPWKRKVQKRKHQKQRRFNKYFDSAPLKKNLKWDWIRRKRSLTRVKNNDVDDDDNFEPEEPPNNKLPHLKNDNINEEPETIGLIKNRYKTFDKDIHDFESLYKGDDNVYRAIKKRLKRTAGDMKELAHGLRNLPPLQSKEDELYAMLGDKVSLDCVHASRHQKSAHPVFWNAERSDMLAPPDVVVNGPGVVIKKIEARNSGNYTCTQNGKTRTVRLTVVTVPQFYVVFIPMYSSKHGCSYDDLRAMKHLGPLMSRESCTYSQNCNAVQIDEPICMEDKDDGSIHLRATAILTTCPHPEVKCSAQCRRDLQCALALLCAANAPVLHGVKVVVARQAYNKTLIPSHGNNRRLIVTHTLRKKDLQKHTEYHQLAASMCPGNLDIVVSCPAGYYLIRKQKICAACPADTYAAAGENTCYACAPGTSSEPGAARCKLSLRRMRRYDWWWYPPCGYAVAAVGVLCACVVCTICALVSHVTSRSTARGHAGPVNVARVDSRWTWSRRAAMKRCSSTSAGVPTRGEPPSPSAVILARLFRASASSSRATDSQETKFEQWKEKNTPPPLPPVDFDLS